MLCGQSRMRRPMQTAQQFAARVVALMDLTRLEDDADDRPVRELCMRAATPFGHPAAVCVFPRFIRAARATLAERGMDGAVAVASVANFPAGDADPAAAAREVERAVETGADEVDVVFPWRALLEDDESAGRELVRSARTACAGRRLKVIVESGMLGGPERVRRAAEIAIEGGADFIKTSTGKARTGATPEAARAMLETIAACSGNVGFKVSGGVRTVSDARQYMQLAERIMGPDWVTPAHFRIGASGLLDALLAEIGPGAC